jgi:hypothetical protein
MLAWIMDPNQGSPSQDPRPGDGADPDAAGVAAAERLVAAARAEAERLAAEQEDERLRVAHALHQAERVGGQSHQGLLQWTVLVFVGAFVGFVFHRPDAALFLAACGLFALTQSWDVRDRARTGHAIVDAPLVPGDMGHGLRIVIPLLVPLLGALLYLGVGVYARGLTPTAAHVAAANWCLGAAVVCGLMALPVVQRGFARILVPYSAPGHTARLTASFAVLALLLPVPARLLIDDFLRALPTNQPLVDTGGLVTQLVCEVLIAAAAVGLWVSRDLRQVRERLGLHAMRGRDWLMAGAGLAAVILLNAGMEWLERTRFPELWQADQAIVRMLVGNMSLGTVLLLGLSAGAGEEILVRGALQPRTGVFWAALLFSAGHVQYTWFGMLVILLLGITLGLIRRWSNTTTVITVHMLYDVVAALQAGGH